MDDNNITIKLNSDSITTAAGVGLAALTAAQPVMNMVSAGTTLHQGDWIQLGMAVFMSILGYFTNKKGTAG